MKRQVAFTLRFDPVFYERIKVVSAREGRSVTSFIQEAVSKKLSDEDVVALYNAFTLVGEDIQEASVDFAQDAQREAALKDV
jgi:predicted DNA-binding protein